MRFFTIMLLLFASPIHADIDDAIALSQQLHREFAVETFALREQSKQDCRADAMQGAYHRAFDAWVASSTFQFGPIQDIGGPLTIGFWPDKKGFTPKALKALISEQDRSVENPIAFDQVSIAGKGLFALDYLMYDAAFRDYEKNSYTCRLVQAISYNLNQKGQFLRDAWSDDYLQVLKTAGEPGNLTFMTDKEVAQAFLTSLTSGLEYIEVARLARPLGTFERERPKRAEAWRSNRPIRNVEISLKNLAKLAGALGDGKASETRDAFKNTITFAEQFKDRSLQNITKLPVRFETESLLQLVGVTQEAARAELSTLLGVSTGFNALDGD